MSTSIDPVSRLALALHASPKAYAVLLGSGISASAGVPTGLQIVADLVSKVAAMEGAPTGGNPVEWYRRRFGEEPDYSKLLLTLAASPTERNGLLRSYFEPTASQGDARPASPTAAHHAVAGLVAQGHVSVILTTNFDRLMEQSLEAAGVTPVVLSTPDSLEGTLPLGRARCTLVKLNGDYLDTRIKNTPIELDSYHPAIERLLDRILDEYGVIVCGWSADWDTALCRAFERVAGHRYSTFWATRSAPAGAAARIVSARKAEVVTISGADDFFVDLGARLAHLTGDRPSDTKVSRTTGLPFRAASFVGRRKELRQLQALLRARVPRLLTLVGAGGTGKTTLAIRAAGEVAANFADGVVFVDLAPIRDAASVPAAVARAIGLEEVVERPIEDLLVEHLRGRQMLLLLDNFEHVLDAADLVRLLLANCPRLNILVTSREALHIQGEQVQPIPPLDVPAISDNALSAREIERFDAVQLFVDRARSFRPDFQLTAADAPVVAEICRRLDGLPLAIELAAARTRLFAPRALLEQLQDRLRHLGPGLRDLPERQRTLQATIDWSYRLLTDREQTLFELLSVFSGADLEAVEEVAGALGLAQPAEVLEDLDSLCEKSMIRRAEGARGMPRFSLFETIKEAAHDRLQRRPDLHEHARRAHASYFADLATGVTGSRDGDTFARMLAVVAEEVANLRLAWAYWLKKEDRPRLEGLAEALLSVSQSQGWYSLIVKLATDLLAILGRQQTGEGAEKEIALRTILVRSLLAVRGYTLEVEDAFSTSIARFEKGVGQGLDFPAIRGLSYLYALRGDLGKAATTGGRLLEIAESHANPGMLVEANLRVGASKIFIGNPQEGLQHLDGAIRLIEEAPQQTFSWRAGSADPRIACYTTAAFALWMLGFPDKAVVRANAAVALARDVGQAFGLAYAHFHAGLLHLWRRDFVGVLSSADEVDRLAEAHDFRIWKATGVVLSGAAEAGLGRANEGLSHVATGLELYQGLRSPPVFWPILLWVQAGALLAGGRPSDVLAPLERAIESMRTPPGTNLLPELQILKGDALASLGRPSEAETWHASAFEDAGMRGCRMSRLRAATRLARARPLDGTAQQVLAKLYETFAEGHDTRDLQDARDQLLSPGRTRPG
jgi:predicted ATPase